MWKWQRDSNRRKAHRSQKIKTTCPSASPALALTARSSGPSCASAPRAAAAGQGRAIVEARAGQERLGASARPAGQAGVCFAQSVYVQSCASRPHQPTDQARCVAQLLHQVATGTAPGSSTAQPQRTITAPGRHRASDRHGNRRTARPAPPGCGSPRCRSCLGRAGGLERNVPGTGASSQGMGKRFAPC